MKPSQLEQARRLLCALQDHIRNALLAAYAKSSAGLAYVAAVTAADTIYAIDKISEEAILGWFEEHWPRAWPVELVMEGIEDGDNVTFPRGTPVAKTAWKCILDPIDGTRGIMYDKRSAWALAGLAPQRGKRTALSDIVVAAMTELPTSKQWRSDQFSVVRGAGPHGVVAEWVDVRASAATPASGGGVRKVATRGPLAVRPSQATDFAHGFACISKFFPDGKELLARVEEAFWRELNPQQTASPLVFDDQYISTGGQLHELLVGHDRMIADLRPLAFAKLGIASSLVCHPYDICTALILTEAGGVVEGVFGPTVRAPLDTVSPIAWVGFANPVLAKRARPVLRRLLREHLG